MNQGLFLVHWEGIIVDIVERAKGVNDTVAFDRNPVNGAVVDVLDGLFTAGPKQPDAWHPHIVSAR